tara:strand:+ start:243 stop:377 length:135 start_codon:yes stop_codon:yes gene_type:complete
MVYELKLEWLNSSRYSLPNNIVLQILAKTSIKQIMECSARKLLE